MVAKEVAGDSNVNIAVVDDIGETLKSDPPSKKRRRGSPSSGMDIVLMANSRSSRRLCWAEKRPRNRTEVAEKRVKQTRKH